MKPASFGSNDAPLRHWEKRVAAAYLRMMGMTQGDAGRAVGRSKRSIAEWEADHVTWPLAREQARQRWLGELVDASRVSLLRVIKNGDGELSLKVLERMDSDLAPPKQKLEHDVTLGEGLAALLAAALEHKKDEKS